MASEGTSGGAKLTAADSTPPRRVGSPGLPSPGLPTTFIWHALGLLACLLVLVPAVDNGAFATPDEGLYSAQADLLAHGSWAGPRPGADIDHNGKWAVLSGPTALPPGEVVPYARRPLYPLLLTPFWSLGGVAGGMILSVLGVGLAAMLCGVLAGRFNRGAAIPALWLIGLGTPLLFDAHILVGHSLVATFSAAFVVLVCVTIATSERPDAFQAAKVAATMASVVPLVLIRSEGLLLVMGTASALVVTAVRLRPVRVSYRPILLALGVLFIGILTYALNDVWARSIARHAPADVSALDRAPNIVNSTWVSILRPWYPDNTTASAAMALVVVASIAAPLILRWLPRFQLLGLGFLVVGAIAAVYRVFESSELVSGLVPTVPWIVVGLLSLRRIDVRTQPAQVLLIGSLLTTAAIAVTTYGDGGAAEWGGRFFHVVLPGLGVVAVLGLIGMTASLTPPMRALAIGALVATTAAISICAVRSAMEMRDLNSSVETYLHEVSAASDSDIMVFAPPQASGAARVLWRVSDDDRPLLSTPTLGFLPELLDDLPDGRDSATVLTGLANREFLQDIVDNTRSSRWTIVEYTPFNGPMAVYELERI